MTFGKLLKPYKKQIILAPLFKLAEAVLELITPVIVASVIDEGILKNDYAYILRNGGYMIGLAVLGFSFALVCQYMASRAGQGFGTDLRRCLLDKYLNLPLEKTDFVSPAAFNARIINDTHNIQSGLAMSLRLLTRSPFLVVGSAAAAFMINAKLATVFVATAAIISVIIYFIMKKSSSHLADAAAASDTLISNVRENLNGARVVRAADMTEGELKRADKTTALIKKYFLFANKFSAALNPATFLIVNSAIILLILLGRRQIIESGFEAGKLVALINYMTQILHSLLVLATLTLILSRALTGVKRVRPLLYASGDTDARSNTVFETDALYGGETVLEFENVAFRYAGSPKNSLENISFKLKKGGKLGIIGGTASGKSTVVNLISGLYRPTSGRILLFGRDLSSYTSSELKKTVSIAPQLSSMLSGVTLRENLNWRKRDASDDELYAALRTAGASRFVRAKKEGLDTPIAANGKNFSGGQRQRLSLARALVNPSELLVLDDCLTAIDTPTYKKVIAKLAKSDITEIIVSQRDVEYCDNILVIENGRIAAQGTHGYLLCASDIYKEIYDANRIKENGDE